MNTDKLISVQTWYSLYENLELPREILSSSVFDIGLLLELSRFVYAEIEKDVRTIHG